MTTLGGKGVNVPRIGRAFGHPAVVVKFLPADSAAQLGQLAAAEQAELARHGYPAPPGRRPSCSRGSGRVTVLDEPGPPRAPGESSSCWPRSARPRASRAWSARAACRPGRRPMPTRGRGHRSPGRAAHVRRPGRQALAGALPAHPDVVGPNLAEAESLLHGPSVEGVEPEGADVALRAADAARGLVARGATRAIVSAGRPRRRVQRCRPDTVCPAPKVTVVGPIGAGDALVGGLVPTRSRTARTGQAAVGYAVAVASASCEQEPGRRGGRGAGGRAGGPGLDLADGQARPVLARGCTAVAGAGHRTVGHAVRGHAVPRVPRGSGRVR